jgi:hypothetical protein
MSRSIRTEFGKIFLYTTLLTALCSMTFAQSSASMTVKPTPADQYAAGIVTADLNGDGVPDLIETYSRVNPVLLSVQIAKGDGTFSSPVNYNSPINQQYAVIILTSDVNEDNKADVIAITGADMLVYLGNGDGTLATPIHTTFSSLVALAAVADFNHDGNPDVVLGFTSDDTIDVAYGDGRGGFASPQIIFTVPGQQRVLSMAAGDFDGDANADVAIAIPNGPCNQGGCANTDIHILYGDGSNAFTHKLVRAHIPSDFTFSPGDLNQDGITDLVGSLSRTTKAGNNVLVLYGHSNRTMSSKYLTSSGPAFNWAFFTAVVADFNGDGKSDFAIEAVNPANQQVTDLFLRGPSGSYTLQEIVFDINKYEMGDLVVGDFNRDRKPDILFAAKNDGAGDPGTQVYDFVNTTEATVFPNCAYPNASHGIATCVTRTGANVRFDESATWFAPLRKLELWVDGVKVSEQYRVWDKYGWLSYDHTYPRGTHRADIYSAGYDNALQKVSTSFTIP